MKTAVEWLAEKYDYAYWMVKRDEISLALAEEWKKHYLEQAKEMEKEQIINAIKLTIEKEYYEQTWAHCGSRNHMAEQYYNETFKSE
jgi:hypothetical protein